MARIEVLSALLIILTTLAVSSQGLPRVLVSPERTVADAGSTLILPCVGYTIVPNNTSHHNHALVISWKQGDRELKNSSKVIIRETVNVTSDGQIVIIKSFLELCDLAAADHGSYSCVVTDAESGERDSATFDVHVLTAPAMVLVSSEDEDLNANTSLHVFCVGFGLPRPVFTWQRNGRPLTNDTPFTTIYDDIIIRQGRAFVRSRLSLCGVEGDMIGEYTCIASNGITSSSDHTFTVTAPTAAEFVSGPGQINHLVLGHGGNYTCNFVGYPYPSVVWTRSSSSIPITTVGRFTVHTFQVVQDGLYQTRTVLEINSAVESIEGVFNCSGTNSLTDVDSHTFSQTFSIDVAVPPQIALAPVRYSQMVVSPNGQKTAIVACAAFGSPRPSLSWLNRGLYLTDSSQITITERVEVRGGREIVRSQMEICSPETIPESEYTCIATNRYGNTIASNTSSFHLCTIDKVEMAVVPDDQTVAKGESIFLPCAAMSIPGSDDSNSSDDTISITWTRRKPGTQVARGKSEELTNGTERVSISLTEEQRGKGIVVVTSILKIGCLEFEDKGIYSCHVTNGAVNKTEEFDVDVKAIVINPPEGVGEPVDPLNHAGYIGPIVTNILLLVVITIHLVFKELRTSKIGLPLANLCSALVALNFSYVASFVSAFRTWTAVGGCGVLAALFHYLFLVTSFAFAVMVTFVLTDRSGWSVKKKSIFYAAVFLANWGLPSLILLLSAAPNPSNYNSGLMKFCGPRDWSLWLGVAFPVALVHVVSASALVLLPFVSDNVHRNVKQRELLGLIITLLFYDVIWGVGLSFLVMSVDDPQRETLQNVFIITSAVHGLEILFFFCILSRKVRVQFIKLVFKGTAQSNLTGVRERQQFADLKDIECPDNARILERKLSGVSTSSLSPGVNGEQCYSAVFRPMPPIAEQAS